MGRRVFGAAVAAGLAVTLSGCWVQPGFDAGHTRYNAAETVITSANVSTLAPQWSVDVGSGPLQEPLSVNGRVFALGTDGDASGPHRAVAVDGASGDLAWSTVLTQADGFLVADPVYLDGNLAVPYRSFSIGSIDTISAATGAPVDDAPNGSANWALAVVDGELVTTSFSYGSIYPTPFQYRVDGPCNASVSGLVGQQPQPRRDFAFVGTDLMWNRGPAAAGYVNCNPATGQFGGQWETPLAGEPTSVVALGDDDVAYTDDSGTVTALDSSSGTVNWTLDVEAAAAPTAYAAGSLFVTTADGRLVALNAATGAVRWEVAVTGPAVVTVAGDVVYAADTATGAIRAFARDGCGATTCPELGTIPVGAPLSAGPVVDDGRLVVGTTDGRLVAYAPPG
jgi:outer membrane protein assembly factor BamB